MVECPFCKKEMEYHYEDAHIYEESNKLVTVNYLAIWECKGCDIIITKKKDIQVNLE